MNVTSKTELGSAPAPGAVFRAPAENLVPAENPVNHAFVPSTGFPDAKARPATPGAGALPVHWIYPWPQMPPLPPPGQPVLIRLATTAKRQAARQELRTVLRHVLANWTGQPPAAVPVLPSLHETPLGPIWSGELAGHSLTISLSYGDNEAWIGLLRAGIIGIDVLSATNFTEVEIVARLYLGPAAWSAIHQSPQPARAFALAWTALEARLKCLKQPLIEWPANQNHPSPAGLAVHQYFDDHRVITVATVAH